MEVKDILKKIRKEHSLTQKQFAELFGVTERTLQKWEKGESSPTLNQANRVCESLNIPLNAFATNEEMKIFLDNFTGFTREREGLTDDEVKEALTIYKAYNKK